MATKTTKIIDDDDIEAMENGSRILPAVRRPQFNYSLVNEDDENEQELTAEQPLRNENQSMLLRSGRKTIQYDLKDKGMKHSDIIKKRQRKELQVDDNIYFRLPDTLTSLSTETPKNSSIVGMEQAERSQRKIRATSQYSTKQNDVEIEENDKDDSEESEAEIEQARSRFSTIRKENLSNEHLAQSLASLVDFAKQQLILNARLEQVLLQNEGQSNLLSPSNITKAPENGNKKLKKKSAKTNDEKFKIKLDYYSGEPEIDQFLTQFESCAEYCGWDDDEKAVLLIAHLKGPARQLLPIDSTAKKPTYKELSKKLKDRFGPSAEESLYLAQVNSRRRRENETIQQLAQWFRNTGSRAYPEPEDDDKSREKHLLQPFIASLTDIEQRKYVHLQTPKNLSDAIKFAMKYEEVSLMAERYGSLNKEASEKKTKLRAVRENENGSELCQSAEDLQVCSVRRDIPIDQANMMESLKMAIEALNTAVSTLTTVAPQDNLPYPRYKQLPRREALNRGDITCFNCGKPGHIASRCSQHKVTVTHPKKPSGNEQGPGSASGNRGGQN